MTSNLGADIFLQQIQSNADTKLAKEAIAAMLEPILKMHLKPEFLNRLDEVLLFVPLQQEDMSKIALIELHKLKNRLLEKGNTLSWIADVVSFLAQEGYDPIFGARPLKRFIQQKAVNLLASAMLSADIQPNQDINLFIQEKDKKISYTSTHK